MLDWSRLLFVGHAFAARYDLPIPLVLFIVGGAAVVFASFLVVLPRTEPLGGAPVHADRPDVQTVVPPLAVPVVLVLVLLMVAGMFGSQNVPENIVPTAFWLVAWIAVPISCGVIGDWTRTVNPFAELARIADRSDLRRSLLAGPEVPWPGWLGWWPATLIFFVVACGELVFNATATEPFVTAFGLLIYAFINVLAGLVFGSETWLARGEMFSVLYNTWGRLGWFRFGAPGSRRFGGGLEARFEPHVSRITFVLFLLVSVSFDGLLATPAWKHAREHLPTAISPGTNAYLILTTLAFVALLLFGWVLFGGFAAAVRQGGSLEGGTVVVLAGLLPSLVPIAFGYLVAHNAEYLVINGQLLFPLLGNPAGVSWWPHLAYPFNDSYEININLLPSSVVWYTQVALIVFVHVVAVILAHDYLIGVARTIRQARRAEWFWIVDMVAYTMSSLWLLAQPLVKGG